MRLPPYNEVNYKGGIFVKEILHRIAAIFFIASFASAHFLSAGGIGTGSAESTAISGDLNADGAFNVSDVVLLQKWLLAVPDTELVNWKAADFCEDNRLNVFDLCLMKRKLLSEQQNSMIDIDLTNRTTTDSQSVIISENSFTITKAGTYHVFGTLTDGTIAVEATKDAQIELILDGADITSANYAPIYVKKSKSTTITLRSENTLTNTGTYATLDNNNVDAVVFSKSDLIFNGEGSLTISSDYGQGITGKDNLYIENGTFHIDVSGHAIEANDSITVNGGTLDLKAGKDTFHTENDDNANLGIFTMNGGNITINSEDDAIHAVASLNINDGILNIENCVEGLEAAKIHINGGDVFLNASDDGINATVGAEIECLNGEALIHFAGGRTEIVTNGDALDSNGDILIEDGEVLCQGPGNVIFGYGAIDYVNKAEITGGRFIALTSKGKSFSESSTQPSITLNLTSMVENVEFSLKDSNGNILVSEKAKLPINSVIVSIPELEIGNQYIAQVGENTTTVTQKAIVTNAKAKDNAVVPASRLMLLNYEGLEYYLYTPSHTVENMPLILYLHGGANRKKPAKNLLSLDGFPMYLNEGELGEVDAYIAIPKLDIECNDWAEVYEAIDRLINHLTLEYPISEDKIALTGHSMGGTGTYQLQLLLPDTFVCIAPLSGSVENTPENIAALSQTNVWAFIGTEDTVVDPQSSRTIISALQNAGANAELTEFQNATHTDVPALAYKNSELIQWMLDCCNS